MSNIALEANDNGTGTLTIAAPNTNTDRTLTLPDEAGTILTSGDTDFSNFPSGFANGITGAELWVLESDFSTDNALINSNLSRYTDHGGTYIGTGMSESGGTFTFPSTGKWLITQFCAFRIALGDNVAGHIKATEDNSTYDTVSAAISGLSTGGSARNGAGSSVFIFDVTDTSTHKIQFWSASLSSGSFLIGGSSYPLTHFLFQRLGDT